MGASDLNLDAHGPSSTSHDLHGRLNVVGIEVWHLSLGDLTDLILGDLANLVGRRVLRALLNSGSLLNELSSRRGLEDEAERAVLVDGDFDRDDVSTLSLSLSVVGLAELHDVDTMGAKSHTNGRGRGGLSRLRCDLDDGRYFLLSRHVGSFFRW